MARKIVDVTNSASLYDILSQTPKNFDKHNYFLKELQDKVDAEWEYRPNRVDVEYEVREEETFVLGLEKEWEPIEVVIQTNKSQKGEAIADDNKNIVFKNILEDRFGIGSKFRFAPNFNLKASEKEKNVWLGVNVDKTTPTANLVIQRCNGSLGSTYLDAQGLSHYHYEPVVQARDITSTSFSYSEVAVSPQAHLVITAQYNEYTSKYFINQRFIVGARDRDDTAAGRFNGGQVYRITAIDKGYSLSTWNPEKVGLIKLYVELTEASPYDDWNNRIAYQNTQDVHLNTETSVAGCTMVFKEPAKIPSDLYSEVLKFTPVLVGEDGQEYLDASKYIKTTYSLENWPERLPVEDQSKYITFEEGVENDIYSFSLSRKKVYMNGDLVVTCTIDSEHSPTESEITTIFKMVVRRQE